ncbi:hypothetical protein C8R47DRAFT_121211 [Mycena vitilis]|nr:hypothetical protein C8R47DRAFT_121211 [Mycena vitilis]
MPQDEYATPTSTVGSAALFKRCLTTSISPHTMPAESPLNPGSPRKRSSLYKFSPWIGLIPVSHKGHPRGIGQQLFWFTTFSHSRIYQNQTLGEIKNRAVVVRPLIDEHQTFDIVASIWTLPADERDGERIGESQSHRCTLISFSAESRCLTSTFISLSTIGCPSLSFAGFY